MSLPIEVNVVVQMGHVARKRGSTGTRGHRGSEQDFVKLLGPMVRDRLVAGGLSVDLIGADDARRPANVFVSLHQDGSRSKNSRGASVGYPIHGDGETLAKIWKARYALAGWLDGFRRDNYTVGLRFFYAFGGLRRNWWKRAKFESGLVIEHGFATTPDEDNWMWDNIGVVAEVDADSILQFFKKIAVNPAAKPVTGVNAMVLREGLSGAEIRNLQILLNMFSGASLKEDGDFGPATKIAVVAYQIRLRESKLLSSDADGVWGPDSVAAHQRFVDWLNSLPKTPAAAPTPIPDPPAPVAEPVVPVQTPEPVPEPEPTPVPESVEPEPAPEPEPKPEPEPTPPAPAPAPVPAENDTRWTTGLLNWVVSVIRSILKPLGYGKK